jgi:hypothetical protein
MKNIITGLILTILTYMMFACKSGKASCDAYSAQNNANSEITSNQASK